jgi:hypothetical protein
LSRSNFWHCQLHRLTEELEMDYVNKEFIGA